MNTIILLQLQNWSREATRCNLCMLPVSSNLLAASHYEKNTSPLHCPVFVPVSLNSIFQVKDQGQWINSALNDIIGKVKRLLPFHQQE